MKKIFNTAIIIALSFIFVSCFSNKEEEKNDGKLTITTSFYAMYDFTTKIAGDKANVINLIDSGTDPHDWEPSSKNIIDIENSDLFIYNGAGMEHWVDDVLNSLKSKNIVSVETSKNIKLLEHENDHNHDHHDEDHNHDHHDEGYNHESDPHVWLNPMNVKIQMNNIKEALIKADVTNKDYYENNYQEQAKKLDSLDKEFRLALKNLENKNVVVSHSAFSYLCDAYGLNQLAIEGLSSNSEPDPIKMREIIEFIKKNKVSMIFVEKQTNPKVVQEVAKATNTEVGVLHTFEKNDDSKDYFTIMKENLEALKGA